MYSLRANILQLAHAVDDNIDNERRRAEYQRRRRARHLLRIHTNPFTDIPEAEFVKTFRLGKNSVRGLIDELVPLMARPRRNDSVSPEMKILIALAFYASGSYQTLIGQSALHNVSQITVSRAINEVTEALNKIYHKYIKWPKEREERNAIKAKFYQKFKFPGVVGCIDGTHVAILRPHSHEERYYNRKGFHSLNVMIICDADLNILCVDASKPGADHDCTVWQSYPLCPELKRITENTNEQVFLLGDSGYPLRKTMMTPILNTIERTPQHNYYVKHVTARNTVERCIGVLKARFRCLLQARALHYSPITAGKIVNACCILHNIANAARAPLPSDEVYAEALRLQQVALATQAPCLELNDGNKIPMLALGTGRGTAKKTDTLDDVRNSVFWALEAGYRHIDTAAAYDDEEQVGQGIADAIAKGIVTREQVFVTTKLWNDKHARDQVVPALRESLTKLGLDYVDLYLIHFPISLKSDGSYANIDYLDTWKSMEEAKQLGLAKSIGVSNFNASQIDRVIANSPVKPAVNEIEVNPTLTQEQLVNHCLSQGIAVMAYSPFGFMVSRDRKNAIPPHYDDPIIGAMAAKYGKNPGQIVLRYLLDRGLIPIPKSTNQKRIAENINVFDFHLTEEEIATISKFNKNTRVIDISYLKDHPYYPHNNY